MKKVIILAGILLLNGCASIRYSCTGDDKNSSGCASLSEVANNIGSVETPVAIETDVISRKAALKKTAKRLQEIPHQGLVRANVGEPILTPPKTMRIFYTPFKDEQGDLNVGGYVYVQLNDAEWVIAQ
ncbi:TraV family lipoprotein [Acinetobacter pittii]|uniref:TraV family lipoprotein n=1 Tax=Acinetobacter calcoaceticus/baumannii complex TaxID=909768 RepID=UPI0034CD27C2